LSIQPPSLAPVVAGPGPSPGSPPVGFPPARAGTGPVARVVVAGLASVNLVVVCLLWGVHGGVGDLGGSGAELLTSLGRLAGLVSAHLMLVQVALMARVPWVERAYGQDELARLHRLVGFWSVNLLAVHIVLVTLGYAGTSHENVFSQVWSFVRDYPGLLLAVVATALFVLVSVTSVRIARRRLRYESWHLLHLYAYLGVGLALPHQIWTGGDFVATPWARAYWWTVYGLVTGSVLVFRLGVPLFLSARHRLVVQAVVQEAPGVVSLHLRGHRLDRMPVAAGQFFVWRFLGVPGWTRGHPYSLSAAPRRDLLRVTVKSLGDDSRDVSRLRPGARVFFEGPFGRLTSDVRTRRHVTLLACGVGITPLRALLESLPYGPGEATLVYRASTDADLVFRAELDALATSRGAQVWYLTGPRATVRASWLPRDVAAGIGDAAALLRLAPAVAGSDVYVCGPQEWTQAAATAAREAGVPAGHLHVERFSW
jgi:predicted ferric reductase